MHVNSTFLHSQKVFYLQYEISCTTLHQSSCLVDAQKTEKEEIKIHPKRIQKEI